MTHAPHCPLCQTDGGRLIVQTAQWRLIHAEEAGFPAFYRLIWQGHMAEWSDLSAAERQACGEALAEVETLMRQHLQPQKMNVASLGNVVPHLHWHLIARFAWDSHFPDPVWAAARRPAPQAELAAVQAQLPALEQALQQAFAA